MTKKRIISNPNLILGAIADSDFLFLQPGDIIKIERNPRAQILCNVYFLREQKRVEMHCGQGDQITIECKGDLNNALDSVLELFGFTIKNLEVNPTNLSAELTKNTVGASP